MKTLLVLAPVLFVLLVACGKKEMGCTPVSPQSEEAQIVKYAGDSGIVAVKHTSGIYYQIMDPGAGVRPTINSIVSATYVGRLLNGTEFDSRSTPVDFALSKVIEGWGIGIPLIAKGGRIKLIIPSSYAYGCIGSGERIPPNSVLYFDVVLTDVK